MSYFRKWDPYLDVAKRAAFEGGRILKDYLGKIVPSEVDEKAKNDFVTYVDKLSEETVKTYIKRRFPEHSFLAEESGKEDMKSDFLWIIDPLDGTVNYIHSFPFFSISIALEYRGSIVMGVIYDPIRDDLFWGSRGEGAFWNGRKIQVSSAKELKGTLLATGFPHRAKDRIDPYLKVFKELFIRATGIRRAGSAAMDLAYVAAGIFDGFFEFGLSKWDVAAGSIIVEEAGGVVTDFAGGDKYLETGNIIAGPVELHSLILDVVKRGFGGSP